MTKNKLIRIPAALLSLLLIVGCARANSTLTPTLTLEPTSTSTPQVSTPSLTPTSSPIPTQAPPAAFSMAFNATTCIFDGPTSIPSGEFSVTMALTEQSATPSAYFLFSLEKGKTLADLTATQGQAVPSWILLIDSDQEDFAGIYTKTYNTKTLITDPNYLGQPVYFVCTRTDPTTGQFTNVIGGPFGPIEIH